MRRFHEGTRMQRVMSSKVLTDTRWTYALLTLLACYSVFAAITLWALFR